MTEDTSRRQFLWATGAAAVGIGCGVPLIRAMADERSGTAGSGPRWAMVVDTTKCAKRDGCDACRKLCPSGAIIGAKGEPYIIDQELCIGCGICAEICPHNAVLVE